MATKAPKPCSVEHLPDTVITEQLFARLNEDKGTVALLVGEEDLDLLIDAMGYYASHTQIPRRAIEFAADMKQLRKLTFGK